MTASHIEPRACVVSPRPARDRGHATRESRLAPVSYTCTVKYGKA